MKLLKRVALLIGQPEEARQNAFVRRFIKEAFSKDYNVCVFAMYEKLQNTDNRKMGESNIFSLVEYDMFEKIAILADTIQTPGELSRIEEELHANYKKTVIFIGGESKYYNVTSYKKFHLGTIDILKNKNSQTPAVFDFNEGTMLDYMLHQTKIRDLVNVIKSHVYEIRPFESFDLCLNIGWADEGFLTEVGNYTSYSDNMLHAVECGANDNTGRAGVQNEFSRKLILPALHKKSDKPRAYFFTPLFFEEHCFGYAVINYGDTIRCYDAVYKRWLNSLMQGLGCFLRFNMVDVTKKQEEYKTLDVVSDILDNNRFKYHFQPIVDAVTGDIYAYEALMRTNTEPPVSPLDVIQYAEKLGRLCDVEHATFANVFTCIEEQGELFKNKKVFINSIPGIRVSEEDEGVLRERTLKLPTGIVIELTEQAEIDDEALETMKNKCKALGVGIAVDDYGTGYSNVYNLLRYMPDVVKVDRMLLSGIQFSSQKQHFVKEIVEFSHNNDITVLAEGVETSEELKMVIMLGVDLIQGYYTARPSAEIIQDINEDIKHEIIQYGQLAVHSNKRKIYEAGDTDNISLVNLVSNQYSKIVITNEKCGHGNIEIAGRPEFIAGIDIEIGDSYSGTVTLKDIYLSVRNEQPTIKIGENCDVTLVFEGENIIEQGGILVPESSKLTVKGAGNLLIKQIAINGYGIGNDKDGACGILNFEQDGLIKIKGNIVKAVGIGAGRCKDIQIKSGMYAIQFIGKEAVGIGSLDSDVKLSITNCGLDFDLRCSENVGVGSLHGSADIDISHAGIKGFFSSNKCVCIGVMDSQSVKFRLIQATGEFDAHSNCLCGFGSISADTELSLTEFSFKLTVDGDEAIALGNLSRTASVLINGDMIVNVSNKLDYDIGAGELNVAGGASKFSHNGKLIERGGD